MAKFKIEHFKNQTATLRDLETDECMHSSVGAWNEAQTLYVLQSQLEKRLRVPAGKRDGLTHHAHEDASKQVEGRSPLVLYDVGLGIGANAIAALAVLKDLRWDEPKRPLHLISFEKFPEGMAYALSCVKEFPYLHGYGGLIQKLLDQREVHFVFENGGELHWILHVGDFRDFLKGAPPPELIYFDLYSPKRCPHLWSVQTFRRLYQKTLIRQDQGQSTLLITYSASTAVRAALILSGFYVGYGVATSDKRDTTVASTHSAELASPLGAPWLEKWRRSSKPYPHSVEDGAEDENENVGECGAPKREEYRDKEALYSQLSKLLEKK